MPVQTVTATPAIARLEVMTAAKNSFRLTCSGATLLVPSTELSKWGRRLIARAPLYRAAIASRVTRLVMMVGTAMDLQHHTWSLCVGAGHKRTYFPGRKSQNDVRYEVTRTK